MLIEGLEESFEACGVRVVATLDEGFSTRGEANADDAAVGPVALADDEVLFFQSLDGSSDGAAGQEDLFADCVDREWTAVEEYLKDREIAL